jgi:anti-anti-sigma factor
MSAQELFRIRQEDRQGRYRLVLSGELDLHGAAELEDAITRLCEAGALEIEIDLREIVFIDSPGVRAMLWAREKCAEHRSQFFIIPGTPHARDRTPICGGPCSEACGRADRAHRHNDAGTTDPALPLSRDE